MGNAIEGIVTEYDHAVGFGYIASEDLASPVFFCVGVVQVSGYAEFQVGDHVKCDVVQSGNILAAKNVTRIE